MNRIPSLSRLRFGGVRAPARAGGYSPLTLSPLLWIDATRGLYSDAGTTPVVADGSIRQWNEFSGNNRTISQATSGSRPAWKTNVQNGLPGVLFDNVDDVMFSTLTRASITGSSVWYASVVTPVVSGAPQEYYGVGNIGGSYHQWSCGKDVADKLYTNGYDGSDHTATAIAASTATGVCVINTFNNGGNDEIYRDGTLQQQVASGTPSIDSGRAFTLGKLFYAANFYLHELIVVDGSPTAGQIADTTGYLTSRWGIA